VRYLVDRAFAREFAGQLLLFAVLVVLVTAIGMTAIFFGLFSAENAAVHGIPHGIDRGPVDALWWALKYVVRLPAFEDMYGATAPILVYSTVLSIMGLAVFGVLVSLINNSMRDRIELLRRGDTLVKERGHVVILGWNNKVFSVLRRVARLDPGARVVVLARMSVAGMGESLRLAGIPREKLTVILRSGIPTNRKELERVAVDRAAEVIVLSGGSDDSDAIKTVVLLATWGDWPARPPTIVAEVAQEQNFELAEIAARERVQVVSSSRASSKIIVQTLRNPGLAGVYDEIMSADGNSVFVQHLPGCAGRTMRELSYGFDTAVPIGISWLDARTGRHKAGLNPEPDYDLAEDESLVLLARHDHNVCVPAAEPFVSRLAQDRETATGRATRVLLIGLSGMLDDILAELNAHAILGTVVTVLSSTAADGTAGDDAAGRFPNLSIDYREGDATRRSAYEGLDLGAFDSIAVLAEAKSGDGDPDTRTLRILLRLSEISRAGTFGRNVVVELLDVANRDIIAGLGVRDVVVSTEVISAQLAQIARQPMLGAIYRELLSAGGVEIALRPVDDYVDAEGEIGWWDLVHAAQERAETALGIYHPERGLLLNPPRGETYASLGQEDQLVVLAEQLYR